MILSGLNHISKNLIINPLFIFISFLFAFINRSMVQNKLELLGQAGISGHTFKEADTKFMAVSESPIT